LLKIRLKTAFDQGDRKECWVMENFHVELAVGVRVFGSNAVFGQCAGRARELDAVGEEALAGGGKLESRSYEHSKRFRVGWEMPASRRCTWNV
jgi:hypothetical protein